MAHREFFSTLGSRSELSLWEVDQLAFVLKNMKREDVKNGSEGRNQQQQVSPNSSEIPNGTRTLNYIFYYYQKDDLLEIIQLLIEFSYVDLNRVVITFDLIFCVTIDGNPTITWTNFQR